MGNLQHYHNCEQRRRSGGVSHHDQAARNAAVELYGEAERRGAWLRFWLGLRGRGWRLQPLENLDLATLIGQHALLEVQAVPLDRIVGSGGRPYDFDRAFYPLRAHTRERWIAVADLWYRGVELPPVQLVRAGDAYFVVDGHHRISVARAFGASTIAAFVTVWHLAAPGCPTPDKPAAAQELSHADLRP